MDGLLVEVLVHVPPKENIFFEGGILDPSLLRYVCYAPLHTVYQDGQC